MAKCHILVDALPSKQLKLSKTPNWDLCVFVKKTLGASLQCPVNSLRASTGDGYISLVSHLTKFSELGQIPMNCKDLMMEMALKEL